MLNRCNSYSESDQTAPDLVALNDASFAPAPDAGSGQNAGQLITEALDLLRARLAPQRRLVHAGDVVCQAGAVFSNLYVLNSGFFKIVTSAPDGREQIAALKFRGDWLGFDGIANDAYKCHAVAMDTGEVWVIRYEALLAAAATSRALLRLLHQAMSREITHERESLMTVCTLRADARVAEFLRQWADALAMRGLRTDPIALRMTRAEIGSYLGMTLETVSRALTRLARDGVIEFASKGRRDVTIPNVAALATFVQRGVAQEAPLLQ